MTIGNVSELSAMLSKLGLYGNAAQPAAAGSLYGGANSLPGSSQSGGLTNTVVQALSQIGVTNAPSALGASSSSSSGSQSASQQNASQTLQSFMQTLLTALQTQAAANGTQHGASALSATSASAGGHRHGRGHGHHGVGGGLQSLIQQLSASSSATSSATSATSAASGSATATATNASLASLQQSFNQLVSTVGGAGNQATLGNFLTTLASDLSAGAHTGNLVSTQA